LENKVRQGASSSNGDTFERQPDFDLARYLDEGFRVMRGSGPPQAVTLRFAAPTVR
jgi:hypothetical protein